MPIEAEDQEALDRLIAVLEDDAPQAAADIESILMEADTNSAKARASFERYQALAAERGRVQAEIGMRQQSEQYGEKHDPQWHAKQFRQIAKITARMEKITAARKVIPKQFNAEAAFVAFAHANRGTHFKPYAGKPPKKGDGLASFEAGKAARKTLLTRQAEIINAPLPIAVAKAQAERDLAAFARDTVSVTGAFMAKADRFGRVRQGHVRFPTIEISTDRPDSTQSIPNTMALLTFACGDVLKAAVFKAIDDKAKSFTKPPLTEEQRKKKSAEIESALADNWYQVELGYRAAKAEGHDVVRPSRMPAEAVLLIVEESSPRKKIKDDGDDAEKAARRRDELDIAEGEARRRRSREIVRKRRAKAKDWLG